MRPGRNSGGDGQDSAEVSGAQRSRPSDSHRRSEKDLLYRCRFRQFPPRQLPRLRRHLCRSWFSRPPRCHGGPSDNQRSGKDRRFGDRRIGSDAAGIRDHEQIVHLHETLCLAGGPLWPSHLPDSGSSGSSGEIARSKSGADEPRLGRRRSTCPRSLGDEVRLQPPRAKHGQEQLWFQFRDRN